MGNQLYIASSQRRQIAYKIDFAYLFFLLQSWQRSKITDSVSRKKYFKYKIVSIDYLPLLLPVKRVRDIGLN